MELLSKEELYFSWFLEELEEAGYIDSWGESKSYLLTPKAEIHYLEKLKTKEVIKKQVIEQESAYKPDFEINWNISANNIFIQSFDLQYITNSKLDNDLFWQSSPSCVTEVKPHFDQNNMTRLNTLNRKAVLDRHNIYVNLVKVPEIFKTMFVPKKYLMTDTGKQQRLIHFPIKSLEEYVLSKTKNTSKLSI